ncbi:MAG: hypothetical protein KAR23_02660 [Candidatus Aenigmarchaeota archaeon]|nr:hypothetical protein [Candidatus Aenigmarchaeota archaeon]
MAYEAASLTEDECYELLVERFDDVRESVEGRNNVSSYSEDQYISEQSDAGHVASLKNYYQNPSEKNLMRLISDVGGGINTVYSPLGVDFFKNLLESKHTRNENEEKAYEVVKLQESILNTDYSVWEKALESKKDEFAWVRRVADCDDELYKDPFVLCYGGTLKVEHGIDGKDTKKAALLDFLREHNVPMPEEDLREYAESIISLGMMYVGTPMPSTGTSITGMHLYEKNHLDKKGLNHFITSSMEFGEDSPFEYIQITEDDGSYFVRSFLAGKAEASDYDEDGNLKSFSNLAVSKTLSELTQYLLSKNISVEMKNERIEPIETFEDDINFRFVLNSALLPES